MANQFYTLAIHTLNKLENKDNLNSKVVLECWKQSLIENKKNYLKGCPKNAFTSIVLNNQIIFDRNKIISKDKDYGEYDYCIQAIQILKENPNVKFSASELWKNVLKRMNILRSHQGEMDVVLALWDMKKIT